jgi:N-acetylmuramoyl-L-alanine amidase
VGFSYQLNTTTLSPGQHTITVSATDTDGVPDTGTATVAVMVTAVPPSVQIDAPAAGSVLSGVATVSGWALDNRLLVGTAIGSVQVKVDGVTVGAASYGVNRPDVCNNYPGRPGCPNVGYTYQLNTTTFSPGTHTITVSATDTDGTPDVGSASVTVTISAVPPAVYIDTPTPGTVLFSGLTTVSGWAIDNALAPGTAIGTVQVKIDGTAVGTAVYGLSRPDVCNAFPGRPDCPNVGFTFSLNTTTLSPGAHLLTVTAADTDATPDSGSWSITIQMSGPPSVFIDTPAQGSVVSGTVTIAGWAVDNTTVVGTAIRSVQVKVDGVVVGNATYGVSRPDVCNAYPGRPDCPNVGFTYQLNTATLTSGQHTITVSATDSDGISDSGSASVYVIH